MKLNIVHRASSKKSNLKRMRREGVIPAVLYSKDKTENILLEVSNAEFCSHIRHLKSGHLPVTIFTLVSKEKEYRVIVKEIQYAITTYAVTHLDFEELTDYAPIKVKIPVEWVGLSECPGIKAGGGLRPIKRHIPIRCLPADLPPYFQVDLSDLNLNQSKTVGDISFPKGVIPLAPLDTVIGSIAKR